jgi:hypothetical protein
MASGAWRLTDLAAKLPALEHDPEKWEPVFGKIMLKQKAGV